MRDVLRLSVVAMSCLFCLAMPMSAAAQQPAVRLAAHPPPEAAASAAPPESASLSIEVTVPQAPPPQELGVVPEPAARAPEEPTAEELPPPPDAVFLHGFRLGYLFVSNTDQPIDPSAGRGSQTYAERYDMRSEHMFMIGYEAAWRMIGHDWLNLLLIGNVMIAGLEQSRFFPSGNLMLGFEIAQMAQIGVGVSVTPTKEEPAHIVFAAGWTPRIGSFYVPVHAFFVPDIQGNHKLGLTVGINFF